MAFTMFAIGANLDLLYICHFGKHEQIQYLIQCIDLKKIPYYAIKVCYYYI